MERKKSLVFDLKMKRFRMMVTKAVCSEDGGRSPSRQSSSDEWEELIMKSRSMLFASNYHRQRLLPLDE